ncbi:MAG: FAD-binding oxidoreductase [Candidatus Aminicenantes bacterium]|nr:MAG: FAD-binding oxidoreductase [Candidatus Aminicenantes bacterium]
MSSGQEKTADVIIIGGGIMGLALAYYLSQKSRWRIVLLEKQLLAQAATGLSVGGLRQQFSQPANILLSQRSLQLWHQLFALESQTPFPFHQVGYLFLAQTNSVWEEFQENVETQKQWGVPVELLSAAEIKKRWPFLFTEDLSGGTFCWEDGYTDPYQVAMVYAQACRRQKVIIREKTPATGIVVENSQVKAVMTPEACLWTPVVINAAGAWAGQVAALAGLHLPIWPVRRQVFVTQPVELFPRPIPLIIDFEEHLYFREEGPAYLLGMSDPDEPPGFREGTEREFLEKLIEKLVHRAPAFAQAAIARGWSGLYAMTPDENALIGPVEEVEGFWVASGFSGHGFQHAAAVADLLSDWLIYGHCDFDLGPFRPNRFLSSTSLKGEKRTV